MPSINRRIAGSLTDDDYSRYSLPRAEVREFLSSTPRHEKKRQLANQIIRESMEPHNKEVFSYFLKELAHVEEGILALLPRHRDHVVHAVYCFLFGIYLSKKYLIINDPHWHFCWKLTALFHDIAYPLEIASRVMLNFSNNIQRVRSQMGLNQERVVFKICPDHLCSISTNHTSLDLIQMRIDEWNLKIDANKEFQKSLNEGSICHGMLAALILLRVLDDMYVNNNPTHAKRDILTRTNAGTISSWNQNFFDRQIVSAMTAIFLHNLPGSCFEKKKMSIVYSPAAYFLKLCDTLQEWERPSGADDVGFCPNLFDCELREKEFVFLTRPPYSKQTKLREDIGKCLDNKDLKITINP